MNQVEHLQKDLINRIKTITGHLGGIEKMIEQGKDCEDVLIQITAVKASMDKLGALIIENYAEECFLKLITDPDTSPNKIKEIIKTLIKFSK